MIVSDVNLLLYAYDAGSARHKEARVWLDSVFRGQDILGLPWQVVWAFIRISTNPRIAVESYGLEQALTIVDGWMRRSRVKLLIPGDRHWQLLQKMLTDGQVRGAKVTDAELAAITVEYGGVLHTTDRDFARFPGLRWTNPLAS